MKNDQQQRMEEATAILLGTILAGAVIFLVIYSLPDWQWIVDRFWQTEVMSYGYQR